MMEAFFAVGAASVAKRLLIGHGALVSFAYIGSNFIPRASLVDLHAACPRMFLDSGAFTAWRKGTPIDLDAYVHFAEDTESDWSTIAALDDIEDWRRSRENWIAMLRRLSTDAARKLVPVFHEGEPIELLDEYIAGAAYVGLGRTEGRRSKEKTLSFYDECFNRHPDHRFHAFGNSDPVTLEPYPFASFDSTSWERDATYSHKHGWPWARVSKESRMCAYIEACKTIEHRPTKQRTVFDAIRDNRRLSAVGGAQ